MKDITDVDISRLSENIAASDAAVAGLKEELSSISTCNAKGKANKYLFYFDTVDSSDTNHSRCDSSLDVGGTSHAG